MRQIIAVMISLLFMLSPGHISAKSGDPYYRIIFHCVVSSTDNERYADWVTQSILHWSAYYQVDPLLAAALFKQESGFNMQALSPTGAIGIAQIQPATAATLGIDPYNPAQNIEGGIRYLAQQLRRFSYMGDWTATYAVAAYNAGPGSIYDYGGQLPPYEETCRHVNNITEIYIQLIKAL